MQLHERGCDFRRNFLEWWWDVGYSNFVWWIFVNLALNVRPQANFSHIKNVASRWFTVLSNCTAATAYNCNSDNSFGDFDPAMWGQNVDLDYVEVQSREWTSVGTYTVSNGERTVACRNACLPVLSRIPFCKWTKFLPSSPESHLIGSLAGDVAKLRRADPNQYRPTLEFRTVTVPWC